MTAQYCFNGAVTTKFAKEALSFLTPDRLAHWTIRDNTGNPAKAVPINQVIQDIKKTEVRKDDQSQARRDLKRLDFQKTLTTEYVKHMDTKYFESSSLNTKCTCTVCCPIINGEL
jgi:hypothetical protein